MADAGAELLVPLAENPIMGFRRVFASLAHFIGLLSDADRWLEKLRPDVVVPIDYPGFNVNLALLARRRGIPTHYFICPQYWAWAPWRIRRFARAVNRALVIFPFEREFFRNAGVDAEYVGHPVSDTRPEVSQEELLPSSDRSAIALLPGSRSHEVSQHLPWMLKAADRLVAELGQPVRLVCTHLSANKRDEIRKTARDHDCDLEVRDCSLAQLLRECRLALVSSGTATLETALFQVPSLVLYRVTPWQRRAAHYLVTSPYISQPNLLAGQEVFPEFLATSDPSEAMAKKAALLFRDGPDREKCEGELRRMRDTLLQSGVASRAAQSILGALPPAE